MHTETVGVKPGVTYRTYDRTGIRHKHRKPCFDDQKKKEYYLDRYRKGLEQAKRRGHIPSIKFYQAGIRHWKTKGKKIPPHLKKLIADVTKAIDLAESKMKLKEDLCLNYNSKYLDYIENGNVLGRDMKMLIKIHNRVLRWLAKNHPEK